MSGIGPGDLVVCVYTGQLVYGPRVRNIRKGATYRVSTTFTDPMDGGLVLRLVGVCANDTRLRGYCHTRFRKLNDEPDNAELIADIKRCRPMKTEQPA
jgi:hypothetical protein